MLTLSAFSLSWGVFAYSFSISYVGMVDLKLIAVCYLWHCFYNYSTHNNEAVVDKFARWL